MKRRPRTSAIAGLAALSIAALAGCSAGGGTDAGADATANDRPTPRIAITYDGGVKVLDAETLAEAGDVPVDGFARVNPAGDGRHVMVSTERGFEVLDAGTWTDEDGQSSTADPAMTDLTFDATTPGHVVRHAERTVLFDDGTGDITMFDTAALLPGDALPATDTLTSEEAHHGVAIQLEDGTVLATIGTPETRSGARHLDASGEELSRNEECPGIHGEGTTKGEAAVFGCEDGILVFADGEFTKLDAPDEFGRSGNAYVSYDSAVAVGDYKTDPDHEGYLLTQLVVTDTEAMTLDVVDLPDGLSYTWKGVGRDDDGNVIVLGSDGSLNWIDPADGTLVNSVDVIEAWESPVEWQDSHPSLTVADGVAYVTEPASNELHAVDLATGDVLASEDVGVAANEIALVTG